MMAQTVIRAEVDRDARLLRSDTPLIGLQARAGGKADGPLVIPQLARLAKLAMRTGAPISRPILAGDDECDISMWVKVVPHADGASLEMVDWIETERAARMQDKSDKARAPLSLGAILAPDPHWEWRCDRNLRLMAINRTDKGEDNSDWLGRSLSEYFLLQPTLSGQFPLLLALAEQEPFNRQPALALHAEKIAVELWAIPIFEPDGQFSGYQGYAGTPQATTSAAPLGSEEDELILTEVLEAAPVPEVFEGQEAADGLLGLGANAGDFSRRIDGALRRPLGRIIANAETISGKLEGPIRQDYANYASDIADAGRHLMDLINDLADLQAIERPDFRPAREDVDLADLGRRTAGLLAMKARDRQIKIDAPDIDETVSATGEFRRVLQILINLVNNAIRYSPEGSMIWIRAESENSKAIVTVADQGRGVPPDQHEIIFDKFERLGRDDSSGSGLGLYIARRLARAMNGDIVIDSASGQGARFSLILPAKI